ncbi:hypothetical protein RM717_24425 [Streptomyces griseus]|uniref:Uncharacterized protein n=1 Tax=Streptomyces stephensoniae TaxID=3375367 RepID=A0ABU2W701_9ACTN|nr:hypothetical protein [Streptomyces griseus]MDT0493650.1 hypothetical protein [Streptomyces griseus]
MTTATLPTRPTCRRDFEDCSCGASPRLPRHELDSAPSAGLYEDADNKRGPERDETDRYHRLVQQLVADGDRRARRAGRQAPRTLQEMAPGLDRQPILRMVDRPLSFTPTPSKAGAGADDACVLCGRWLCGGNCFAPAPTLSMRAVTE